MVESLTPEREVEGFDTYLRYIVSLSKDTFTPRKVLVILRKRLLRPMTEELLTGTLSINTNKQTNLYVYQCSRILIKGQYDEITDDFAVHKLWVLGHA